MLEPLPWWMRLSVSREALTESLGSNGGKCKNGRGLESISIGYA